METTRTYVHASRLTVERACEAWLLSKCTKTENRDGGSPRSVGRSIGVPTGAVAVVAIPVHPKAVVGDAAVLAERGGHLDQDCRSGGHVAVFESQPRFVDLAVVHPAASLLPASKRAELAQKLLVAGNQTAYVHDRRFGVELMYRGLGEGGMIDCRLLLVAGFIEEGRRGTAICAVHVAACCVTVRCRRALMTSM